MIPSRAEKLRQEAHRLVTLLASHACSTDAEENQVATDCMGKTHAAIDAALKARDMEWWETLALNDAVAPEPKAVALWQAALRDAVKDEEAEECLQLVLKNATNRTGSIRIAEDIVAGVRRRIAGRGEK